MVSPALGNANLPWSNTQSLTHATVGRGPAWLSVFGPPVLYVCTSMPKTSQLTDCRK